MGGAPLESLWCVRVNADLQLMQTNPMKCSA